MRRVFCFTILEELLCLVELVGGTNQVGHPVLLQQLDVVVHRAILKQVLFSYFVFSTYHLNRKY